jgi:hypothetical protein
MFEGNIKPGERGQAALIIVVFFVLFSLVIVGSAGLLGASHIRTANELLLAKQAYVTAESAVEDYGYRLLNNLNPPGHGGSIDISDLNGGTAHIDVTIDANGKFNLDSEGIIPGLADSDNRTRKIKAVASLSECNGVSFESAMQAGFLGVNMNGVFNLKNWDEKEIEGHPQGWAPCNLIEGPGTCSDPARGEIFSNGPVEGDGAQMWISGKVQTALSPSFSFDPTADEGVNPFCYTPSATANEYVQKNEHPSMPTRPPGNADASPSPSNGEVYLSSSGANLGLPSGWSPYTVFDADPRKQIAQSFVAPMTGYVTGMEFYARAESDPGTGSFTFKIAPSYIIESPPGSGDYEMNYPPTSNNVSRVQGAAVNKQDLLWDFNPQDWRWVHANVGTTNLELFEGHRYWMVIESSANDDIQIALSDNESSYVPNNTCYGEVYCERYTGLDSTDENAGMFMTTPAWRVSSPDWYDKDNSTTRWNPPYPDPRPANMNVDMAFRVFFGSKDTNYAECEANYSAYVKNITNGGDIISTKVESTKAYGSLTYLYKNASTPNIANASSTDITAMCAEASPTQVDCSNSSDICWCKQSQAGGIDQSPPPRTLGIDSNSNKPWQASFFAWRTLATALYDAGNPDQQPAKIDVGDGLRDTNSYTNPNGYPIFITPGFTNEHVDIPKTSTSGSTTVIFLGRVPDRAPICDQTTDWYPTLDPRCEIEILVDGMSGDGIIDGSYPPDTNLPVLPQEDKLVRGMLLNGINNENNTYSGKCPLADEESCYIFYSRATDQLNEFKRKCLIRPDKKGKNVFLLFDSPTGTGGSDVGRCKFYSGVDSSGEGGAIYIAVEDRSMSSVPGSKGYYGDGNIFKTLAINKETRGDVILYAPMGQVRITDSTNVIAISGAGLYSQGAEITYKDGVAISASPFNNKTALSFESFFESQ